jgi:RHS repeat-associated protein
MLKVWGLFIILLLATTSFAQTRSYVQEDAPKISGIKTNGALDSLSQANKQTTLTYFDGLGRPIQSVAVQASPAQKDMVQPVAYNALGRQTTNYLPYVSTSTDGSYHSNAIPQQKSFYQITTDKIAVDTAAYSAQVFENSPLLRLLKEGMTGTGFQPVAGQHYKTVDYRSNTTGDNVLQWAYDGTTSPTYYAANTLSVTDAKDEQGIETFIFTNKYSQTVLKRQVKGSGYLDTYYIYNIAGLVGYVIPPKADSLMQARSNYSLSQSGVDKLLFKYEYDDLGRVVEKTVPAAGVLYIVYDPLNRPVLVQDGNLRNLHKWNYIKYDLEGRAISQGIYADASIITRADMQFYVNGLSYSTTWAEVRNTTSATGYYTNLVFPTTNIEPLAYSYFDDYDLDGNGTPDYAYANQSLPGEGTATGNTHSLLTMLRKRTVGSGLSDIWLTSAYFYDNKERIIQTQGNNQLNSTVADVSTTVVNFISKPTVSLVKKVTSATTAVKTTYNYDVMYRLTTLDQQYNSDPTVRVANYVYNEIGQLVKKNLHALNGTAPLPTDVTLRSAQSVSSGQDKLTVASNSITLDSNFVAASGSNFVAKIVSSPYLQSVDYRYNIRGQMLSINNSTLTVNSINDDADDVFGMEMSYNETPSGLGNTPSWNGQLTAVRWMSRDGAGNKGPERNYNYNYDQLNRLTSALYQEKTSGSWNGNGAYDEKDIRYDVNGNIMALKRNALLSGTVSAIDNLTYTYDANNPNQLKHMVDGTGANYTGYGFRNLTGSTGDYAYDDNGNLVTDPYKGLSLTYNVLNRADVITVTTGTGKYIAYTYSADGVLIRKQQYNSSTLQKTTDYIDGFVYENTTLAYFGTPEGRVLYTGGKLQPQYIITDQQGNARVTFINNDGAAKVIQENSYYAFGLVMTGGITPTDPNKNLYNGGSEWQNDFGDLPDLMQTYYRNYDQALGRWTGVDPDAESVESLTSYNYSANNPVMFNDPLGNNWILKEGFKHIYVAGGAEDDYEAATIEAVGGAGNYYTTGYVNYLQNQALAAYGIKVYDSSEQTVEDLVNMFNNGKLETGKNGSWQVIYNHAYADASGNEFKGSTGIIAWGNTQGEIGYRNEGNWHGAGGSWDDEDAGANRAGLWDSGINVLGGGAEVILGLGVTPVAVDGWSRVGLNTTRFIAYSMGKTKVGDAIPSNLGAVVGRLLDGNLLTTKVGMGQRVYGFGNDLASFLVTGGNGSSLVNIFDAASNASMITKWASYTSILANYYMFYGDANGFKQ